MCSMGKSLCRNLFLANFACLSGIDTNSTEAHNELTGSSDLFMTDSRRSRNPLKLLLLGSLEREVLGLVCESGGGTVREICNCLSRPLAYTTVMTTLDRLYKKDLLVRQKEGRGYRYAPRTGEPVDRGKASPKTTAMENPATRIPLVSYLLDAVGTYDEALLQELEKTIAERRQQFEREEKL
jgi:predicted transcriptional regulator